MRPTVLQGLLANPNSSSLQAAVRTVLDAEISNRQIEYATLVTINKTILLSPNTATGTCSHYSIDVALNGQY
jgi:hypothetical protein